MVKIDPDLEINWGAYRHTLTPQQRAIVEAAHKLLTVLREVVPGSTAHYAVEEAIAACRTLVRPQTPVIQTRDYSGD